MRRTNSGGRSLRCGCCAKVTRRGIGQVSVLSPAGQPEVLAQRIGAKQAVLIHIQHQRVADRIAQFADIARPVLMLE